MKVLHYLERIEMIHKLVDQERTGTPAEFARRLGISRTRLYEIMDDLKLEGAPIAYSRSCRTFYYEEPFHISITFELRPLSYEDTRVISGGQFVRCSPFFPDDGRVTLYSKLTIPKTPVC